MVRLGLGDEWQCLAANDFDKSKCATYTANFGGDELIEGDIAEIDTNILPDGASLAWASFPCQDLSLAGARNGLAGTRSGTFWAFWKHIQGLNSLGKQVPIIVLENVVGLLSSRNGEDFKSLVETLSTGYKVGALVIDAVCWLPQSRPRLFIVAIDKRIEVPRNLTRESPTILWQPESIQRAYLSLRPEIRDVWVWWNLPEPTPRSISLQDLIETLPQGVKWNTDEGTEKLVQMMSPANKAKLQQVQSTGLPEVGTIYKRTRRSSDGARQQRAEVRFDGVAGCLRTPGGGSSRQTLLFVQGERITSRLLSPREAARLMGLPESYILPPNYNDAYHLAGDGVAVPVVDWLQQHLLTPLVEAL